MHFSKKETLMGIIPAMLLLLWAIFTELGNWLGIELAVFFVFICLGLGWIGQRFSVHEKERLFRWAGMYSLLSVVLMVIFIARFRWHVQGENLFILQIVFCLLCSSASLYSLKRTKECRMTVKDKLILQIIFIVSQLGLCFSWFGHRGINDVTGAMIVLLGGTFILWFLVPLFEILLWDGKGGLKWCSYIYGVLLGNAIISLAIWYQGYSFFSGETFYWGLVLPGFYVYLVLTAAGWIAHSYYVKKKNLQ